MKKLLLFLIASFGLASAQQINPSQIQGGAVVLNPSGGASQSISSPLNAPAINNEVAVNQFTGSDIGAQITSAIIYARANLTTCDVRVLPGIISTTFQVPSGCVITFTPSTYTVSAQIWAAHRDTVWIFNHAYFNVTLDNGTSAFFVGKQAAGTVNTSGTAITCVTGCTNFNQIDTGDIININSTSYNVTVGASGGVLTIAASAGTQTGASYAAYLGGVNGLTGYSNTVTLTDLWLIKGSGTTTAMDGLHIEGAADVLVANATVANFNNAGSYGYHLIGSINGQFRSLKTSNNAACMNLSGRTFAGVEFDSNNNSFFGSDYLSGGGSTNKDTVLLGSSGSASGNNFYGLHTEGNSNPYQFLVANGCNNHIFGWWSERNGATGGSEYENEAGCTNEVHGATVSAPLGTGETAFTSIAPNTYTAIEDASITGFSVGWSFAGAGRTVNISESSVGSNAGTPLQITNADGVNVGGGPNVVYRCTIAGTLPVGALTIATGDCGASVATLLQVN